MLVGSFSSLFFEPFSFFINSSSIWQLTRQSLPIVWDKRQQFYVVLALDATMVIILGMFITELSVWWIDMFILFVLLDAAQTVL